MAEQRLGNPAVVGLAGFGLTTLVLQFHNVGWMPSIGPVVWLGLIFGGTAQLIAGILEMKTGNNFGFCAFTSYGAFWITLCLILLGNKYDLFKAGTEDIGWFLVAWTLLTAILWVGSLAIHGAMAITFTTLLIGFIFLDLAHFGYPSMTVVAGYDLMVCALSAWYMMARVILNEVYGREVLPAGKPWVTLKMRNTTPALALLALSLAVTPAITLAADPNAATPHEVVTKVYEAVQYLNDKGLAGFSDFNNNKDARWVWKDSYVFVYSCRDNVMIAHPLRPDMVGKPIKQMKDDKDKPLFQELCKVGARRDGGWVEYWWPKPGEGKASRKVSFVHSAQVSFKSDIQVSAGIYDDKMSVEGLNKLAAQQKLPTKDVP